MPDINKTVDELTEFLFGDKDTAVLLTYFLLIHNKIVDEILAEQEETQD